MKRVHHRVRNFLLQFIDVFYPLFRRWMPLQLFRYAACGGGNTLFNIVLYYSIYHYILKEQILHLGFIAFTPHIAAFLLAFCITFPIGFYLSMYVVFQGSFLRRRIQFIRYLLVALACVVLNYALLKLFVEILEFYPTPSLMMTTGIVVLFSYVAQRYFSFRKPPVPQRGHLG
jgi:putative flippase GtrA